MKVDIAHIAPRGQRKAYAAWKGSKGTSAQKLNRTPCCHSKLLKVRAFQGDREAVYRPNVYICTNRRCRDYRLTWCDACKPQDHKCHSHACPSCKHPGKHLQLHP